MNNFEEEKSKTEEILEQRNNIKADLSRKLRLNGFTDNEVEEVMLIIDVAETDIQIIKDELIGTNINPQNDPMAPLNEGVGKIKERQLRMQKELNETIAKIMARKQK